MSRPEIVAELERLYATDTSVLPHDERIRLFRDQIRLEKLLREVDRQECESLFPQPNAAQGCQATSRYDAATTHTFVAGILPIESPSRGCIELPLHALEQATMDLQAVVQELDATKLAVDERLQQIKTAVDAATRAVASPGLTSRVETAPSGPTSQPVSDCPAGPSR